MSDTLPSEWSTTTLDRCGKWYSGGTPDTSVDSYWNGDIPWITSSSLKTFRICDSDRRVTALGVVNGTRLLPKNTILFVVRGMSLKTEWRVGIAQKPVAFGQDCKAIVVNDDINPLFLAYMMQSREHQVMGLVDEASHGTGRLQTADIKGLVVPLPPLPEQRKIAAILSTWDEAIGTVARLIAGLEQRKQGLMQRLLIPNPETGQPKQRLRGFTKPWEIGRFEHVFARITRKNAAGNENVLTASGRHGLVSQVEYFNRSVAGANLENYYLLYRGEYAYNRSSSDGYPFGAIKQLTDYDAGILSTLYICFGLKAGKGSADFFRHYFEAGGMNRGIYSIAQEGARNHGLLNVGITDFFGLDLPAPIPDEQARLAVFFDAVDAEIEASEAYLASLRQQKKGLMQRLLTGEVRVTV